MPSHDDSRKRSVLDVPEATATDDDTPVFESLDTGLWATTILLSLVYIAAGLPKVGGMSQLIHRFEEVWGYPEWFRLLIGGLEFIGGILLIIPGTAFWAATGLSVIMIGALYTHLVLGEPSLVVVPALCLSLLLYVAYARRPDWLRE